MNSLADAAAVAAASATSVAPSASTSTSASAHPAASTSDPIPSSSSTSSTSLFHPTSFPPDQSHANTREEADASTSPTSQPSPSSADMIKNGGGGGDTPAVRRALLDSEKPEKRGSNLACLKCRAIKVKCSRANVEDERCKRCNRLDLVCEFKEHHRGRKPKKRPRSEADSTGADEEDQLEDDEMEAASFSGKATSSPVRVKAKELSRSPPPPTPPSSHQQQHHHHHHQQQHHQHHQHTYKRSESGRYEAGEPAPKLPSPKGSVHGRWFGPYLQPIPSFEDSLFPRKHPSHSPVAHLQQQQQHNDHSPHQQQQQQQQSQHHQPSHSSSYHHDRSRELPPLSVPSAQSSNRNGLSPNDHAPWDRTSAWSSAQSTIQRVHPSTSSSAASAAPPQTMATDLRDDVVRQHVISLDQAHELFDYYFAELNPPLALLDSSLHTVEYCRQNAPILFSTIVSVASRFFQPQLHRQCHRIAKSVLNLAAAEEICTTDHIQALILVITWKDPGDRTILRKAIRAIGYAYELGLHTIFENLDTADSTDGRVGGGDGNRARSDSYSHRYKRRLERDRQRTWIVLCLVHELVRRDDRNSKPRARIIPLEDYPDPYIWIKAGGDVLLSVDSRLAWSLDMSILTLECEPFLDLINRSEEASTFGSFFDRYRGRLDMLRKRYFDVRNGVFHPRFPMDTSAVAELPYVDGFRDFFICQSTWHWAAKVATTQRRCSDLAEQQDSSRSAFWFAQTVDTAMRCLRLFAEDLCKPGYVRVGHDYLVITASEVTKWFYLYRDHLDAATVVAGVEYLRATLRELSQPQRLASGEVVDTEREAPGYLLRFIGAIFDAGLNQTYEKAKTRLAANVDHFRSRPNYWGIADQYGHHTATGRDRALSSGGGGGGGNADEHGTSHRGSEGGSGGQGGNVGSASMRRPTWAGSHSSYQGGGAAGTAAMGSNAIGGSPPYRDVASATARYSTAPSLNRGRSELSLNRISAATGHSPSGAAPGAASGTAATSYERASVSSSDKTHTSPTMFDTMAAPPSTSSTSNTNNTFTASNNPVAPHPAYLASPGPAGSTNLNNSSLAATIFSGWSGTPTTTTTSSSSIAPSWSTSTTAIPTLSGIAPTHHHFQATDLSTILVPPSGLPPPPPQNNGEAKLANVAPLAADIGKNSIEGLAACLNTRDLTYWQDILGFDLGTPAV